MLHFLQIFLSVFFEKFRTDIGNGWKYSILTKLDEGIMSCGIAV